MNKKELLTVGYSTLGNRLAKIKYLDSVSNLVVIQNPNSDSLPATDVTIKRVELQSRGVAKSRNAVIENTTTEYLLFGDDDIEFKEESINAAHWSIYNLILMSQYFCFRRSMSLAL